MFDPMNLRVLEEWLRNFLVNSTFFSLSDYVCIIKGIHKKHK